MKLHPSIKIHSTAIVYPNVVLAKNVTIEAYAVIGSPAEMHGHFHSLGMPVVIGAGTIIREYVTVNAGTTESTVVGDNCVLLCGSHVGHDAKIGDQVTLSCNALIGGHSYILDKANIGLGATVKQRTIVGSGAMVGMNAAVVDNLAPWGVYAGVPAKFKKENTVGMKRFGLSDEQRKADIRVWEKLCALL